MIEAGFIKSSCGNLPKIKFQMVALFLAKNKNFCAAKFRNTKEVN